MSELQAAISRSLAAHRRIDGLVCQCSAEFPNESAHQAHVAQTVESSVEEAVRKMVAARAAAHIRAMVNYWGPDEKGSTSRSRAVYTGSQFAGWLKKQAVNLHRQSQQPPRQETL